MTADGLAKAQALGVVVSKPNQGVPEKELLVVTLGWYGSSHRYISKYTRLLNAAGYTTMAAICPPSAVFSPVTNSTRRFAADLLDFLMAASRNDQKLAFYVFSNGGGFPLEQIDLLLRTDERYTSMRPRVEAVVFDSAPCYMHALVGAQAMAEGRSGLIKALTYLLFFVVAFLTSVLSPGRPQKYWSNMTNLSLGRKELYLYSNDDPLCDAAKLEQLIQARRVRLGNDVVQSHKWETSRHVGHLLCHTKEYTGLVLGFLDGLE